MPGKRFVFSLESVLKLRTHETEQARLALTTAARKRAKQEERVRDLQRRLASLIDESAPPGRVGPMELRRIDGFRRDAQRAYEAALDALRDLRRDERARREHLAACRQAEETLETLKEQEAARYRADVQKLENQQLDEQALAGFLRQQQASES